MPPTPSPVSHVLIARSGAHSHDNRLRGFMLKRVIEDGESKAE